MATRKLRRSSGNVFRDLGFADEEAENLRIRAALMARLSATLEQRELTQSEAARMLGISQPRVSDLVRGRIDRFSIDALVNLLARAGLQVAFTTRQSRRVA
jgi:predicted XRE-type DNA-binding protein